MKNHGFVKMKKGDIMPDGKPNVRERVQEIVAGIEVGIRNLFESGEFQEYLRVMSKFHRYSLNNKILIFIQHPTATYCAGFQQWKEKFGRHVKKGEKGITILAPTPYKKTIQEQILDPVTQMPKLDANGQPETRERAVSIPFYKPVKIFALDQTEGKPLPQISVNLTGDVPQFEAFMEAIRRVSPVPIVFKALSPNMDGYFSPIERNIMLREGMSQIQTVCAAIHEVTHSILHNFMDDGTKDAEKYEEVKILGLTALFCEKSIS